MRSPTGYVVFVAFLLAIYFTFMLINSLHIARGQTFTVTGKEAVKGQSSSTYLVFTDKTTYEVEDTFIRWRFDSSDVYGRIVIGKTYKADLQGWRIPFLSMYPNILNPVEITEAPALQ